MLVYMTVTTGASVERPNYHTAAPMGRVTGSHLGLPVGSWRR